MVTVFVNFPLPQGLSLDDFKGQMLPSIPRYQAVPGLLAKNYLYDGERGLAGGAYTFETRAQAEACFNEEWIARVSSAYGELEINYYETPIKTDDAHNEVTK